jgi:type II secretory pathway pseudopilin PulG
MNDRTTTLRDERGISLIEILIALIFISIGLLGIAQLFPSAARGQLQDRMLQGGTYLAQEKLETLGNLTWADANLTVGRHPTGCTEACGDGGQWGRFWIVTAMGAPLDNLKKVTVTVQWRAAGTNGSVTNSTYLRR